MKYLKTYEQINNYEDKYLFPDQKLTNKEKKEDMKYLKTYEDLNKEPEIGDWVVAYRPAKNYDKNIIIVDFVDYVIDVGVIKHIKNSRSNIYYRTLFRGGNYFRKKDQILYVAKNEEDAEEYANILKTTNKYNI